MMGEVFTQMAASPFTAGPTAEGQTTSQPDALDAAAAAAELRKRTVRTEGTQNGVPEAIIALAIEKDYSWEDTRSACEMANMVFEVYKFSGAKPNLPYNPVVLQIADIMVQLYTSAQEQASPPQPDVATLQSDLAAEAGM